MKKRLWIFVFLTCLFLSGCQNSSLSETKTVGFLAAEFSNEFMITMQQSFLDRAKELGFEVKMKIWSSNPETQLNQLQDLIVQKVDALAIRPMDSSTAKELVEEANDAGIPVFLYDVNADGGESVSLITSDNISMGRLSAEALGESIRRKTNGAEAKIAVVAGNYYTKTHMDRVEGFQETIKEKYPEIEILATVYDLSEEGVINQVQDWLNQYGESLDGIYSVSDYLTAAALEALERAGYSVFNEKQDGIVVIGTDGNPAMIQALREGRLSGDMAQNAETIGIQTAEIIAQYFAGEAVLPVYYVPSMLLTPENINSEEVQQFGLWSESYEEKYGGKLP